MSGPTETTAASPSTAEETAVADTSPTPERRPGDLARLIVGGVGVLLAGLWAQASTDVDTNLFKVVNGLGNAFEGVANVFAALGTIWFVLVVVLALVLTKRFPPARDAAIAGAGAWLIAIGLNELLGTRSAASLGITVRTGSGPSFPAATVAVATALGVALAPYLIRPLRRAAFLVVIMVALSAMYLGTGLASDVLGGFLLGMAAGAAVHYVFGAPSGRPTEADLRGALGELGLEVASVEPDPLEVERATVVRARLASGAWARVVAFGRDQRDAQFLAKVWHKMMYKAPGLPVFGSRLSRVEHQAYALMVADGAGVRVPRLLKTGIAGPDAALLVTEVPEGRPLGAFGDALTDSALTATWTELAKLHAAGVAHGELGLDRILTNDAGQIAFADPGPAGVTTEAYWHDRDVVSVLVVTALAVGNERAISAAVGALGKQRVGEVIPTVQAAALPNSVTKGAKHLGKTLKALRTDLAAATGAEDVKPLQIKRLSLVNIGMLAGILLALAIAIPSLEGVDWASVQNEFEHATWGWVVLAAILYPLIPTAWATALMGCVNTDLPFGPTVLVQIACTFLNLITPNGIGGTALQLDYLHKEGVPVASGASAMVLSTGVGGAIQMLLFLGAAAVTATSLNSYDTGGSISLGAIAIGAALVGLVLFIPKVRGKVVPAVKRAATDIWSVLRNPKKGAQLFGGDLAGNLIYPALLGLCLLAFGQSLDFAELIVVQVGAGMLGNVAPVPGGIGVQEAALTAGLTAFGIPPTAALATVLVFRAITFALPPVFGFFTLRWLRGKGYA